MERPVGGNGDDVERVDFPELVGFGHRRAGHTADLAVELEEVLQRDGRQRLRLFLDLDAFLRLDRLMQPVAPLPAFHQPSREFVDDHDPAFLDHVVHIELVEVMGLEGVVDQVGPFHVAGGVETLDTRQAFRLADSRIRHVRRVVLFVNFEVFPFAQLPGHAVRFGIFADVVVCAARNDQRRTRFVDEDVVHFVDDGIVQSALGLLVLARIAVISAGRRPHVVAQVVEAEFVVRAVGDVATIGLLPLARLHVALNGTDRQSQAHVERSHPFHVAACQVVVDRDHVDALAFQRIQIRRQRRHERLAFAGHHLGDRTTVQDHAAHQLHVEVAHAQIATPRLATDRKGFHQQVVQRLALGQPLPKPLRLLPQFLVRHRLVFRFQAVDRVHLSLQTLDVAGILRAEDRGHSALERPQQPREEQADELPDTFQQIHSVCAPRSEGPLKTSTTWPAPPASRTQIDQRKPFLDSSL